MSNTSRLLFRLILSTLLVIASGCAGARAQDVAVGELQPQARQEKTTQVINKVLERFHYRKVNLDDAFADRIMTAYLKSLDANRSFFTQGEVDRFEREARQLDDDLKRGKVELGFEVFRLYRQRVEERTAFALALLDQGFSFDQDEHYRFDRAKAAWPATPVELDQIWRQRVKNDWLGLKLAKKKDEEIRKVLRERYEGLAKRVRQFDSDDIYQTFINAYIETLEPHTSYMSPSTAENFDISMRLSLEGIGAVLKGEADYTEVQRTIPGGPARVSGLIHAGDRIVGVGQGQDGPIEDVVGWRLQDVVDKIRGPKDSVVRLQILPKSAGPDGPTREVTLVRNEIKLEDQAAKAYVVDDLPNAPGLRVGVLEVPGFYRDFRAEADGDKNFRSTTRDVQNLINDLKRQGVDGILVDLRGNGGGSLTEATDLTGLFIDQGPVVQVKDSFGKVDVEKDPAPGSAYTGPLAVLVDRNSASASEIFAAAMQDYGRAIVIGEPTFGKGTVQTLIDLNRYVPGNGEDLGRLRLTMAEFYRISGGSTQLRGVEPDILFPTAPQGAEHGERSLENALPWNSILPAKYDRNKLGDLSVFREASQKRISADEGFRMLTARERLLKELDDEDTVSLKEADRRVQADRREKILKDQRDAFLRAQGVTPLDEEAEDVDEEALDAQQKIVDKIQMREAASILADAVRAEAQRVREANRN
ncbi:MAG: tail-specific protease [Gammaproteobacteria bacterium]|jgi:carboxyl-terminal processing protease|nr:tail-specific protease [Gammaproteobacteria bacterium]